MKSILAKSILTTRKEPSRWFDVRYNMNLYRGCTFGCLYCDSRSDCYHVEDFDDVAYKVNALELLEKELGGKRQPAVVGMGAMSDPYNPLEKELELTRKSLELIYRYGYGLHLTTKSDLVVRDAELIARIAERAPVSIGITITTEDDAMASKIEPRAPSSTRRFEAVKTLASAGIFTGIMMMPILPFVTDTKDNILGLVDRASACGAGYVYPWMGMTLRSGQREYFYQGLDKHFAGQFLKERYIKTYGDTYECLSPDHSVLTQQFKARCEQHGLAYSMKEICKRAADKVAVRQCSMFDGD